MRQIEIRSTFLQMSTTVFCDGLLCLVESLVLDQRVPLERTAPTQYAKLPSVTVTKRAGPNASKGARASALFLLLPPSSNPKQTEQNWSSSSSSYSKSWSSGVANMKLRTHRARFVQMWAVHSPQLAKYVWLAAIDPRCRSRKWWATVREFACISRKFGQGRLSSAVSCLWRRRRLQRAKARG